MVLVLASRPALPEELPLKQPLAQHVRQENASTQNQRLARRCHAQNVQIGLRCKHLNSIVKNAGCLTDVNFAISIVSAIDHF